MGSYASSARAVLLPRRGHGFPGSHGPPEHKVNSEWLRRRYRRRRRKPKVWKKFLRSAIYSCHALRIRCRSGARRKRQTNASASSQPRWPATLDRPERRLPTVTGGKRPNEPDRASVSRGQPGSQTNPTAAFRPPRREPIARHEGHGRSDQTNRTELGLPWPARRLRTNPTPSSLVLRRRNRPDEPDATALRPAQRDNKRTRRGRVARRHPRKYRTNQEVIESQ